MGLWLIQAQAQDECDLHEHILLESIQFETREAITGENARLTSDNGEAGRYLYFQPVVFADDDGSNASAHRIDFFRNNVPNNWRNLAGIEIIFLPTTIYPSTKYNSMNSGERSTLYNGEDVVFEQFLDEVLPRNLPRDRTIIGFFPRQYTSNNGNVHNSKWMINNGYGRGHAQVNGTRFYFQGAVARVLGHEIGHNLGLLHVDSNRNLMAPNANTWALTQWQIDAVHNRDIFYANHFLGEVPDNAMTFSAADQFSEDHFLQRGISHSAWVTRLRLRCRDGFVPVPVRSITVSTQSTSDLSNIQRVALYQTGNDPVFSLQDSTLVAEASGSPGDTVSFDDLDYDLATGNNYLWLVYDIAADSPSGQIFDGAFKQVSLGGRSLQTLGTDSLEFSADGKVSIIGISEALKLYNLWIQSFAFDSATQFQTGFQDDPDQDQLTNLVEYFHGLDPGSGADQENLLQVSLSGSSPPRIQLVFRRRADFAARGFHTEVQTSLDLTEWRTDTGFSLNGAPVPTGDGVTEIVILSASSSPGFPQSFYRLLISFPPQ